MLDAANLLGKLHGHIFPTDIMTLGAALSMVGIGLLIFIYLTVTKRWHWLFREWLTSVDHKKIGIMYIIVAIVMLIRGGADALLLRAQQATSVGSSHGIVSAN